mgnify:FL=1
MSAQNPDRLPRTKPSRGAAARARELQLLGEIRTLQPGPQRQALIVELIRVGCWRKQVEAIAWRWACRTIDREDLVQAGMVGVLTAIDRFDPAKLRDGAGWVNYCHLWAQAMVSRAVSRQSAIVRVPRGRHIDDRAVSRAAAETVQAE